MHKNINDIFDYIINNGMEIGLVTNGLILNENLHLNGITWCRISNGDDRMFNNVYKERLSKVVKKFNKIDWAFSHVCSSKPNYEEIARIVKFANEHKFTHVRLVADLFRPEEVDMGGIKKYLQKKGIDDSIVIYQGRKSPERGGNCYICYLKPAISADGKVYNCCGVQYALNRPSYDFPKELCLGTIDDFKKLIKTKGDKPFNGSICKKCYYMNYNRLLGSMLKEIRHKEFV
jgi:hypothetical protein